MARGFRYIGYGLGGLAGIALIAALAIYILSERVRGERVTPAPSRLAQPTAAELANGPRMLRVNGCVSCHGEGLRGKLFFSEPGVATIYAPNLALLARTVSDAQLERGIRQGIGHDGRSLAVMPSAGYQFLTDGEVAALIAAIRAIPPAGKPVPPNSVGPIGRLGLVTGKFPRAPELVAQYRAAPLPAYGKDTELGRHLVQTNCADCHGADLKGRQINPKAKSVDLDIVGAYDLPQFEALLRRGVAPSGKDLGLMKAVAVEDFKYLTDAEIAAIHAYLVARANR